MMMSATLQASENGLPLYLRDMRDYKVLDRESEQTLAWRMRHASRAVARIQRLAPGRRRDRRLGYWLEQHQQARQDFIMGHLRLVIHVAKTFNGRGLSLQDLIQDVEACSRRIQRILRKKETVLDQLHAHNRTENELIAEVF